MSSRSVSVSAKPRLRVVPPAEATFGDLAGDFAAAYELVPDGWQQQVLDDWLSVDASGLWAALTCGLACPRQNGKNGIIEVRELFGMVGRGEKILHTAHEVKTARKAFKRLQHFFGRQVNDPAAKFPELNARVVELRNVNGQEAIFLDNGGSVEIIARSKSSGRGFTADVLIMDEAQEMSDEDLEALMPTTSAAPLGNPQWIFTGTPPGPMVNGEVFTRTRSDALGESPYRVCWHEWSACEPDEVEGLDLDDRELWAWTNPALGGRLLFAVVEGERSRYSDAGFARERLGVWSSAPSGGDLVLPADSWWLACRPDAERSQDVRWSVDASPDLRSAAIGVSDGTVGLVAEYGPGSGWVVAKLIKRGASEVLLDPKGPAGALLVDLESAGLSVVEVTPAEHSQACGGLLAAVKDGKFFHAGQPILDAAVEGATRRPYGDAWAWNRRTATVDISPLVAVTLARWGALTMPAPYEGPLVAVT